MASGREKHLQAQYDVLGAALAERGVEIDRIKQAVKAFEVEVPSWLFGPFGGGRFGDDLSG